MESRCTSCGTNNRIDAHDAGPWQCGICGAFLPEPDRSGDTSQAVGLIGGAALGAAVGGPVGAVVGGLIGALLGKGGKGLG